MLHTRRKTRLVPLLLLLASPLVQADVCDVDDDGDIDLLDIGQVLAARNSSASGPNDARDADGDGVITVLDARICVLTCTLPGCAAPAPNNIPVADAGPDQTVLLGDTVTLDGSGSTDLDGDSITFTWNFAQTPAGSGATLSDANAVMPTFVADLPGEYVVELVVDDGMAGSAPDSVQISTANSAPVADAGPDQGVALGNLVQLDGNGSFDADSDPLTFNWSIDSLPAGSNAALGNANTGQPTFTADQPGTYVIQLIVNDGAADSAPDTVTITTLNTQPVADAGDDQIVSVVDTVQLDGSGSNDADNNPLTFAWSILSSPADSIALLSDPVAVAPSFSADVTGTYVIQLLVNDGLVDSEPDTVTIIVDDVFTGTTSQAAYGYGERLVVFGQSVPEDAIVFRVLSPNGSFVSFSQASADAAGNFSAVLITFPDAPNAVFPVGDYEVQVTSTLLARTFSVFFTLNEGAGNSRPSITSAPLTTANEGEVYSYDVEASDPDAGDMLTFSLDIAPAGMTIDPVTGLIQWTPTDAQNGANAVSARVTDTGGLFDTQSFSVSVGFAATTSQPNYDYGDQLVISGQSIPGDSITLLVFNPNGSLASVGQTSADAAGAFSAVVITFPDAPNGAFPAGDYEVQVTSTLLGRTFSVFFVLDLF